MYRQQHSTEFDYDILRTEKMETLKEIVKEIVHRSKSNEINYKRNEQAVRAQLVDVLLDFLGWDTRNPTLVEHNQQKDNRKIPNYSLKHNGRIIFFVAASNLSENPENHIEQSVKYGLDRGIELGLITNGLCWIFIKAFGDVTSWWDRIIWKTDLSVDPIEKISRCMSSVSRKSIDSLQKLIESQKSLDAFWSPFKKNPEKIIRALSSILTKKFIAEYDREHFDQEVVNDYFQLKLNILIFEEKVAIVETETTKNGTRAPSPSVYDWANLIPELREKNLNTWIKICDYLGIEAGADSARRVLQKYVKNNKPNWPPVPDPTKKSCNKTATNHIQKY